jgi:hypothetical protein
VRVVVRVHVTRRRPRDQDGSEPVVSGTAAINAMQPTAVAIGGELA